MDIRIAKKILKCPHIFYSRLPLKRVGIYFNGMKEAGGQLYRGGYPRCPQVFGQDSGCRPISGPDVRKAGFGVGFRVMVYDDVGFQLCHELIVIGLGVHHDDFTELGGIDVFKGNHGDPQKSQHRQIIRPIDRIDMGNHDV